MRHAAYLGLALLVTACAGIPQKRIESYSAAYAEMRQAAQAIYADHASWQAARRKAKLDADLAKGTVISEFNALVPASLDQADGQGSSDIAATALSALDAGALYNEAMVALASGQSVKEVQERVGFIAGTIGTFAGAPAIGQLAEIIVGVVERARAREELVESLARAHTVDIAGTPTTDHAIGLLLEILIQDAEVMYQERRAVAADQVRSLSLDNPAVARTVIRETAGLAAAFVRYRSMLGDTKHYFGVLQGAAANPDAELQLAAVVSSAQDIIAQARIVVALLRGAN